MNELEQFKQTYFQECEELLAELEESLLALQDNGGDTEALNAAFRAIHSIKGGGGAFGFDRLVAFSHTFETVLDMMRDGRAETSPENVDLSVRASDIVADLVQAARSGSDLPDDHGAEVFAILQAIGGAVEADDGDEYDDLDFTPVMAENTGNEPEAGEDFDDLDFTPVMVDDAQQGVPVDASPPAADVSGDDVTYTVSLVPHGDMLRHGNEPLLLIRELRVIGAVAATADVSALPSLDNLVPDEAYIRWSIEVTTPEGRDAVEEVFAFVDDDCRLTIEAQAPEDFSPPEPLLPEPIPPEPAPAEVPPSPAPAIEVERPAPQAPPAAKQSSSTIRVDLGKLDGMVNMVGELVITQAMLAQQGQDIPQDAHPGLHQGLEELTQHTRELQENVMAMRAQPVKTVFSKLPRLVRELSAQTGKKVNLVMTGETTEIDKTVIEQLSDPLTHMIRNAVDHGIETPEDRAAVGKPAEGTIHVSAEHRGGRIVIEIRDDGKGVDRDRVLKKAIDKGLVAPNAVLSDEDVDNLILLPGFSTAEQISNISGRGVGMDVVVRNIQNLGGSVLIRSTAGQGSCFSMSLPLTLAVLDGMIVRAGDQSYVLPLAVIVESLRPLETDIHPMAGDDNCMVMGIRGEYVPLVFLHRVFNIPSAVPEPWNGLVVIVETEGGGNMGIVVDEILGQQQVVIKSLEENFHRIEGIAAATILGSGRVALILDVVGLKALGQRDRAPSQSAPPLHRSTETPLPAAHP